MDYIQYEVNQPGYLPVNISVKIWPSLQERREKIKTHTREVKDFGAQIQTLEREPRSPEVKAARERLEAKKAQAEFWREQTQSEYDQLVSQTAFKLFRRQLLTQELEALPDFGSPMTMRAMQPGERPIRPRIEILNELSECVGWLAWFSCGDENLTREATAIREQVTAAYQAA